MPREAAEPSPGPQGCAQADARLGRCLGDTVMEALKYSRHMGGFLLVPFTWDRGNGKTERYLGEKECAAFLLSFFLFFSYTANCVIY